MIRKTCAAFALLTLGLCGGANAQDANDLARRLGSRADVLGISLSPLGKQIAYIAPDGSGERVMVVDLDAGGNPRAVISVNQEGGHLTWCKWPTEAQLICNLRLTAPFQNSLIGWSRLYVINTDGSGSRMLDPDSSRTIGISQYGGTVLAFDVKGETNKVLMTRPVYAQATTGTLIGSSEGGLQVEEVDVTSLKRSQVEKLRETASNYIADEDGKVRMVVGFARDTQGFLRSDQPNYLFRPKGSSNFQDLVIAGPTAGVVNGGIEDLSISAIDSAQDRAIGIGRVGGFRKLLAISLDGSGKVETLLERSGTDVDQAIRIGRSNRVVGAGFATERRQIEFFDPRLKTLMGALDKALGAKGLLEIVDANRDESRLLVMLRSDINPGMTYLYDTTTMKLEELLPLRNGVEPLKLSSMQPITYTAGDGTRIPAYLTLPPGVTSAKRLPAIVMPHGGPEARDEWGFDWMVQFYAQRGFAVLQPNFRGSAGYGTAWMHENGFQSWKIAIGDVNDAGRWLVEQGIADPSALAVVGWSYGGYAALQAGVTAPDVFKAIVAIAPVTDLDLVREDARHFTNFKLVSDFLGHGEHVDEGSPSKHAERIAAPVMLVHGTLDESVSAQHSERMDGALKGAGRRPEFLKFDGLGHSLDDSAARAKVLAESDRFLRKSLGLN
jgi:pimeloyl-ACP methyl ester carboxylesterase